MSDAIAAAIQGAYIRDLVLLVLFAVVLGAIGAGVYIGLRRRSADKNSAISFDDLLLDPITGKLDPARCVLIGGFVIASVVLVYLAFKGTMSDAVYGLYIAGIVVPAVSVVLKTKVVLPGQPSGGDDGKG